MEQEQGGVETPLQPETDKTLTAEGVLREALTALWEQARAKNFQKITTLSLKLYEPSDAFDY